MEIKELIGRIRSLKSDEIISFLKEVDQKTWIYIGAGVVVTVLFLNFLFWPAWIKRPELKKQSIEASNQMIRLKALNAKKPQLEAQKKEIESLLDGFQKKLFSAEEAAFVLGKISKIAQDAEVELISSMPFEGVEAFPAPYSDKYKKFVYEISVEGSYHKIASFVSYLESSAQYFQIQSLGIVPQIGPEKAGKHIADLKLMAVSHNLSASLKEGANGLPK